MIYAVQAMLGTAVAHRGGKGGESATFRLALGREMLKRESGIRETTNHHHVFAA